MNSAFTLNGKGYVGLGYYLNYGISYYGTNQVKIYDPSTNSWTQAPAFGGTTRCSAVGFAIGNTGYFSQGYAIGGTQTFIDTWAYLAN